MPTPICIDGFDHLVTDTTGYLVSAYVPLWNGVSNAANITIDTTVKRTGVGSLKIVENGTTATYIQKYLVYGSGPTVGTNTLVFSVYFRVASAPSVVSRMMVFTGPTNTPQFRIGTDGRIGAWAGAGTVQWGPYVADGNWHRLDAYINTSTTTFTVDWKVDGITRTQASATGQTAANIAYVRFGSATAADTLTIWFDDFVASATAADYPLGPHAVRFLVPNADGTHSGTALARASDNAVINGTTVTAWNLLDEWPPTTGTNNADTVTQTANSTTSYAEVQFEDITDSTVWGVEGLAAIQSDGSQANNGNIRVRDSAGTETNIYSGDQSDTSPRYQRRIVTVPTGGWSQTEVNALRARLGYSSDASPQPEWLAVALQVAVATTAVAKAQVSFLEVRTPTPGIIHVDSLRHGVTSVGWTISSFPEKNLFYTLGDAVGTSWTYDTEGLSITYPASGSTAYFSKAVYFSGCRVVTISFYVKVASAPSSNQRILQTNSGSPAPRLQVLVRTDGTVAVNLSGQSQQIGPNIADNSWHLIDVRFDARTTTHTVDWRIDGTAQTQSSAAQTSAGDIQTVIFGTDDSASPATGWVVKFKDVIISTKASDYPIGTHAVRFLKPNADGTHNAGTNIIERASDGADIDGTTVTAWDLLNTWPPSSTVNTGVTQVAVDTTKYAEVQFEDITDSTIFAVQALTALMADGTGGASSSVASVPSSGYLFPVTNPYITSTSLGYTQDIHPTPSGGWTTTAVNALKARFGYADDVTSQPECHALALQVAVVVTSQQYQQSLTGTMTSSGALVRSPAKSLSGTSTSAGTILRAVSRSFAGTLTSAGVLAKSVARSLAGTLASSGTVSRMVIKSVAGTVTSSGSIIRSVARSFAGSLTSTGTLAKSVARSFTGTLTSSGTVVKRVPRSISGTLSSAGALARTAARSFGGTLSSSGTIATAFVLLKSIDGALSSSGAIARSVARVLAGAVTSTGMLTKRSARSFAGTLSSGGVVLKQTSKSLTGTLLSAGTLARKALKSLVGTVSSSGLLSRRTSVSFVGAVTSLGSLVARADKALTSTLSSAGTVTWRITKAFSGVLSTTGSLAFRVARTVVGTLSSSGTLLKVPSRVLSGTIAPSGTLFKTVARSLTGSLATVGSISKAASRSLAGALSSSGALDTIKVALVSVAGTLGSTGSLTRRVNRFLAGTLSASGAIVRFVSRTLQGALSSTGTVAKGVPRALTGIVTSSGLLATTKAFFLSLAGSMQSSGSIVKAITRSLSGALPSAGTVARSVRTSLVSALGFAGNVARSTSKLLYGTLSGSGSVTTIRNLLRAVGGTLTSSGSVSRSVASFLSGSVSSVGTLSKTIAASFVGAVSFSGILLVRISKALSATLAFVGALVRSMPAYVDGALSQTGSLTKATATAMSGILAASGDVALLRSFGRFVGGFLDFSGSASRTVTRNIVGVLTAEGAMGRAFAVSVSSVLSAVGAWAHWLLGGRSVYGQSRGVNVDGVYDGPQEQRGMSRSFAAKRMGSSHSSARRRRP